MGSGEWDASTKAACDHNCGRFRKNARTKIMKLIAVAVLLTSSAASLVGQSRYETLLVPIVTSAAITGVGGAQFDCALYTYQTGAIQAQAQYYLSPSDGPRAINHGLSRVMVEHGINGRLLSLDRESSEVGLRLVLTSNYASGPPPKLNFVPIVGENDWRQGPSLFPLASGVLPGGAARSALRLYLRSQPQPSFAITVRVVGSLQLFDTLASTTVTTFSRDGDDASYPWYARLDLRSLFPVNPCTGFRCGAAGDIALVVEPTDKTTEYWGLLSITDNVTQDVLIDWTR